MSRLLKWRLLPSSAHPSQPQPCQRRAFSLSASALGANPATAAFSSSSTLGSDHVSAFHVPSATGLASFHPSPPVLSHTAAAHQQGDAERDASEGAPGLGFSLPAGRLRRVQDKVTHAQTRTSGLRDWRTGLYRESTLLERERESVDPGKQALRQLLDLLRGKSASHHLSDLASREQLENLLEFVAANSSNLDAHEVSLVCQQYAKLENGDGIVLHKLLLRASEVAPSMSVGDLAQILRVCAGADVFFEPFVVAACERLATVSADMRAWELAAVVLALGKLMPRLPPSLEASLFTSLSRAALRVNITDAVATQVLNGFSKLRLRDEEVLSRVGSHLAFCFKKGRLNVNLGALALSHMARLDFFHGPFVVSVSRSLFMQAMTKDMNGPSAQQLLGTLARFRDREEVVSLMETPSKDNILKWLSSDAALETTTGTQAALILSALGKLRLRNKRTIENLLLILTGASPVKCKMDKDNEKSVGTVLAPSSPSAPSPSSSQLSQEALFSPFGFVEIPPCPFDLRSCEERLCEIDLAHLCQAAEGLDDLCFWSPASMHLLRLIRKKVCSSVHDLKALPILSFALSFRDWTFLDWEFPDDLAEEEGDGETHHAAGGDDHDLPRPTPALMALTRSSGGVERGEKEAEEEEDEDEESGDEEGQDDELAGAFGQSVARFLHGDAQVNLTGDEEPGEENLDEEATAEGVWRMAEELRESLDGQMGRAVMGRSLWKESLLSSAVEGIRRHEAWMLSSWPGVRRAAALHLSLLLGLWVTPEHNRNVTRLLRRAVLEGKECPSFDGSEGQREGALDDSVLTAFSFHLPSVAVHSREAALDLFGHLDDNRDSAAGRGRGVTEGGGRVREESLRLWGFEKEELRELERVGFRVDFQRSHLNFGSGFLSVPPSGSGEADSTRTWLGGWALEHWPYGFAVPSLLQGGGKGEGEAGRESDGTDRGGGNLGLKVDRGVLSGHLDAFLSRMGTRSRVSVWSREVGHGICRERARQRDLEMYGGKEGGGEEAEREGSGEENSDSNPGVLCSFEEIGETTWGSSGKMALAPSESVRAPEEIRSSLSVRVRDRSSGAVSVGGMDVCPLFLSWRGEEGSSDFCGLSEDGGGGGGEESEKGGSVEGLSEEGAGLRRDNFRQQDSAVLSEESEQRDGLSFVCNAGNHMGAGAVIAVQRRENEEGSFKEENLHRGEATATSISAMQLLSDPESKVTKPPVFVYVDPLLAGTFRVSCLIVPSNEEIRLPHVEFLRWTGIQ
uniref:Uncharacterized protein n=1 Tax=Chromera velia CCMP2878 TaxID=1169474 RepID=A0A0G4F4J9_9ALVE|eukprot:Cvel_2711.t1-p1 / transcript=Cvel_2711.t1 / gene=Cvel_2711 / organism=Chromera_velia_CCMP2878 / gene_product=hypothetical protein / transcript_product=hypothetical protein / location=Cvel_scaffold109:4675-12016(+) / protein_length=1250 / sequence_SO=supercontig / SO=protein_coding / is_pseudo=false